MIFRHLLAEISAMIRGKLNRHQVFGLSNFLSKQIKQQCREVTRAMMY